MTSVARTGMKKREKFTRREPLAPLATITLPTSENNVAAWSCVETLFATC